MLWYEKANEKAHGAAKCNPGFMYRNWPRCTPRQIRRAVGPWEDLSQLSRSALASALPRNELEVRETVLLLSGGIDKTPPRLVALADRPQNSGTLEYKSREHPAFLGDTF